MKFLNRGKKPLPADMAELLKKFGQTSEVLERMVERHKEALEILKEMHDLTRRISKSNDPLKHSAEIHCNLLRLSTLATKIQSTFSDEISLSDEISKTLMGAPPRPVPDKYTTKNMEVA